MTPVNHVKHCCIPDKQIHLAALTCGNVSLVAVKKIIQSLTINFGAEMGERCENGENWHIVLYAAHSAAAAVVVSLYSELSSP